jgi:hypothetical protein
MDQVAVCLYLRRRRAKKNKRLWVHSVNTTRKVHGEFHHLVQELRLDDARFYQYFRMNRGTFDILLQRVESRITKKTTNYREPVSPAQRLAVTLRWACFAKML